MVESVGAERGLSRASQVESMSEQSTAAIPEHPLIELDPRTLEEVVLREMHLAAHHAAADAVTGLDVVDIGCNHGYGSRVLAGKAKSVAGVDISENAIATAKRGTALPNLQFYLSNAEGMPFADGSFDAAVSFQVIEHIEDVGRYLAEIHRVLKPGGKVIFTTPNRVIRIAPGHAPWNQYHVREYDANELKVLLQPFFTAVEISGLYGKGALHDVEYRRVLRKRNKQSVPYLLNLPSKLAYQIDRALGWSESRLRGRLDAPPSYKDFFYHAFGAAGSLDDALDLRAECRS